MRILVVQLRAIGDVLCTTPAVRYLKQCLPDSQIDFLVEPAAYPAVETYPYIQEVLRYDKQNSWAEIRRIRSRRYDVVIDFLNNPRTSYLTLLSGARWRVGYKNNLRSLMYNVAAPVPSEPEYVPKRKIRLINHWLEKLGVPTQTPTRIRPELVLKGDELEYANQWVKREGLEGKQIVIMMPVHKHPICRWRPEGFQKVGLALAQRKNCQVFLSWGPGEEAPIHEIRKGYEQQLRLCPPSDLRKSAAVLKKANLLLANNSGAMHLAVAVGTPTVTIYGPTRPVDWNPSFRSLEDRQDIPLTAENVPCLGCFLKTCPVGHICMTQLHEDQVLKACETLLARESKPSGLPVQ